MKPTTRKSSFSSKQSLPKIDEASFDIEKEISEESLRERRYLWTARSFAIVVAMSLCANIVLLLGLFYILPVTRVQPFYLTFQDKSEQIVRVRPLGASEETMSLITESYIRQYLLARLKITSDINEVLNRWNTQGPVKWMSSDVVFNDFVKTTVGAFEKIRKEGFTRDIEILSVLKTASNTAKGDVWQIELDTVDMLPTIKEPVRTRWLIMLRIIYRANQDVQYAYRLKNPLGFTVVQYAIRQKGTTNKENQPKG
ncbi:MAG: type IV secretion system protein [Alphaproteobacteria bacterium]|nr:type IV secretion system protein [Alphaproteobacteria bacterium]